MLNKSLLPFILGIVWSSCALSGRPACQHAGKYSGTSLMGSSIGTAILVIEEDCRAELSYDHADMGIATETGEVVDQDGGYKFLSTAGGGEYELTFSSRKVVLDGASWHCELTQ